MAQRYCITSATSAVVEQSPRKIITIPRGSVVVVPISLTGVQGLLEVTFNGETVLMFAEDLKARGTPVLDAPV
jgi:hypothetical protein